MKRERVAVVGAGIAGLAHAWSAADRGHDVTVFERSSRACGASIRNFGMIWPIGQPAGVMHQVALQSRDRWLRLSQAANIWANPCGSIHLAHRADEWRVLQEFHERSSQLGYECSLLTAEETLARSSAANPEGLLGGLFSPTELCVNPRIVIREMPAWLADRFGVRFEFDTTVTHAESGQVGSADGRRRDVDRVIVCSGADLATLFPEVLAAADMKTCKLQMLKTAPQPDGWKIGPHLASGLTLRHYRNFEVCPSLADVKRRVASETPELDRYGIHVMASQNAAGQVILGDSHEYGDDIEPFDKAEIDELMLRELRKIVWLRDWTVAERWHGVYAKHRAGVHEVEPAPRVHVCTGLGGAGMTMSFGIAERAWTRWSRENDA